MGRAAQADRYPIALLKCGTEVYLLRKGPSHDEPFVTVIAKMNDNDLREKLQLLSFEIRGKAREYQKTGRLKKEKVQYKKFTITGFEYNDYMKGNFRYGISEDVTEKEEYSQIAISNFIGDMKKSPYYLQIIPQIAMKCSVTDEGAGQWLSAFLSRITNHILSETTSDSIPELIDVFMKDLEKANVLFKTQIRINGVFLEDDEYSINKKLTIRRTRPSDFEIEIPFHGLPLIGEQDYGVHSSAILELVCEARSYREIDDEVDIILKGLRLFKLGSVSYLKIETNPTSILNPKTLMRNMRFPYEPHCKYIITSGDIPTIKRLIDEIRNIIQNGNFQESSAFIALQRYEDALLEPGKPDHEITTAINSLEALYLKSEERGELSHKMSQRAAAVLKLYNFQPIQVYEDLKKAYNIRSSYVHGSTVRANTKQNISEFSRRILEYTRISVVVFMQIASQISKGKFLKMLDQGLLDEQVYSRVKELISKIVVPHEY